MVEKLCVVEDLIPLLKYLTLTEYGRRLTS